MWPTVVLMSNGVVHSKASKSLTPRKHPPYLKMVSDAIVTLKERNGSSQYAIGKFIQDKYKDLPTNFKKRLLNQLKKLVASDKLVKPASKAKPAAKTDTKKAPPKKKPAAKLNQTPKAMPAANNSSKHYGKSFEEAADILGVSRSKLKRICTSLDIKGWLHTSNKSDSHSSNFQRSNEHNPATHTEHAMYSSTRVETILIDELGQPKTTLKNSVKPLTIKATYKEDTVRFPFILSDGLTKLKEQIATRFPLKLESFRLKYEDKDGDIILIACDSDLDLSANDFRRPDGHTVIRLMVCLLVS
ncbi:PB1 domain, RWP-RK domain protein [Artemisia annua]|uniref:PB1 domain, RWP-RK domain protein n=1 Tax=Artemisia annua TaxID=35608 RepID=A0A2U1LNR3_ARTAN|nr:PB1 domain, RWP-RK domain protein [Artemisia annua]